MKKWNAPEVTELNISETANGTFSFYDEYTYIGILTGKEYEGYGTPKNKEEDDDTNKNS